MPLLDRDDWIASEPPDGGHSAQEVHRLEVLVEQLEEALDSRGVIERAKGILMVSRRCGQDEAFALLRRQSQHENVKLREIARRVVESIEHSAARSPGEL